MSFGDSPYLQDLQGNLGMLDSTRGQLVGGSMRLGCYPPAHMEMHQPLHGDFPRDLIWPNDVVGKSWKIWFLPYVNIESSLSTGTPVAGYDGMAFPSSPTAPPHSAEAQIS